MNPLYQHNEIVNVREYSAFRLSLSAIGVPVPSLTWYQNNEEMNSDPTHCKITSHVSQDTNCPTVTSTVNYSKCYRSDTGAVQCTAANGVGLASFQLQLNVQFKPEISFLDCDQTEGLIFMAGESLRLKVTFCGNPKPEIYWFIDKNNCKILANVFLPA